MGAWWSVSGAIILRLYTEDAAVKLLLTLVFALIVQHPGAAPGTSDQAAQVTAEALLEHARSISDIRSPGSPPFELKATFSFITEKLDTLTGTYTETWLSDARWRRETVVGELHYIQIRADNKEWTSKYEAAFPVKAARVPKMFQMFPPLSQKLDFGTVTDRPAIQCALTNADDPQETRLAFCFERKTGVLIGTVEPQPVGVRFGDYSCQYDQFQRFGARYFPRKVECLLDKHRQIEGKVASLVPVSSVDPSLFMPPPGATQVGACSGHAEPPRVISSPSPSPPVSVRGQDSSVTLSVIVDAQGHPQDVAIVNSGDKGFDAEAVRAVRKWEFKPATCDGQPISTHMTVVVSFRLAR